MTVVDERTVAPEREECDLDEVRVGEPARGRVTSRWRLWWHRRRRDVVVLAGLLVVALLVTGFNGSAVPQRIDDEGTYVAQAWAVEHLHALGHYTYWYDHPPLGWLQVSAWTWITGAFDRAPNAVAAGREAMLVAHAASVVVLWVLARRLQLTRLAAAVAVAIFSISPLAVQFHRTVYLDNVAVPWLLAAFALALSPTRRLAAFAGSGFCFGIAVLTKETTLLLLPAVALALWTACHPSTRRYALSLAASTFAVVAGFYVLFATIKGELLPGAGHVSLAEGVHFQLFERASSGSVFDPTSLGHRTVAIWLNLDPVTLALGALALPVAFVARDRWRPIALAYSILLLALLRPGYLPVPYVIAMLPFAALLVAIAGQWLWGTVGGASVRRAVCASLVVTALVIATPTWWARNRGLLLADLDAPMRDTVTWIVDNVPRDQRLIVDDSLWVDLVAAGFPRENVVWYYKIDTDPEVAALAPRGWRDYDVIVATDSMRTFPDAFPQVERALAESSIAARFGAGDALVEVRRIRAMPPDAAGSRIADGSSPAVPARGSGAALLDNDDLTMSSAAGSALQRRLVDERLVALLATVAPLVGPLGIDGFPIASGAPSSAMRSTVDISAVSGEAIDPNRSATRLMLAFLAAQEGVFAPSDVEVVTREGAVTVIRVQVPADSTAADEGVDAP